MFRLSDYNDKVLDHYENPRNVGVVADFDGEATVGTADGDRMRLTLRIRAGIIEEARFQTFGCVAAIASSSIATEMIQGRSIEDACRLTNTEVVEALGGLPQVKIECSVVAEKAIRAAVADYRDKTEKGS
jgi:nitrogen fixation NifU-like protein